MKKRSYCENIKNRGGGGGQDGCERKIKELQCIK